MKKQISLSLLVNTFFSTVLILGLTHAAGLLLDKNYKWISLLSILLAGAICAQCLILHLKRRNNRKKSFLIIGIVFFVGFYIYSSINRLFGVPSGVVDFWNFYFPVILAIPLIAYDSYIPWVNSEQNRK